MTQKYDDRYLRGIELFNTCEFFEAHEVWEDLWQDYEGPGRRFYQGLIQAAVCLHHFGNGNTRGAIKLYHGSRGYLEPYSPWHEGLDVTRFLDGMHRCCAEILASTDEYPSAVIDPEKIPEIHLCEEDRET